MHLSRLFNRSYIKNLLASGTLVAAAVAGPSNPANADNVSRRGIKEPVVTVTSGMGGETLYHYNGSMGTSWTPEERAHQRWLEDCSAAPSYLKKAHKQFANIEKQNEKLPFSSHIQTDEEMALVLLALNESPKINEPTELIQTAVDYSQCMPALDNGTRTSLIISYCLHDLDLLYLKKAEALDFHRLQNPPLGSPEDRAQERAREAMQDWSAGQLEPYGERISTTIPPPPGDVDEFYASQDLVEMLREFRIASAAVEYIDEVSDKDISDRLAPIDIPSPRTIKEVLLSQPTDNGMGEKNSPAESAMGFVLQTARDRALTASHPSAEVERSREIALQGFRGYLAEYLAQGRQALDKYYAEGHSTYWVNYQSMRKNVDIQISEATRKITSTPPPPAPEGPSILGL